MNPFDRTTERSLVSLVLFTAVLLLQTVVGSALCHAEPSSALPDAPDEPPSPPSEAPVAEDDSVEAVDANEPAEDPSAQPAPEAPPPDAPADEASERKKKTFEFKASFKLNWQTDDGYHPPFSPSPLPANVSPVAAYPFLDGGAAITTRAGEMVDLDSGRVLMQVPLGQRLCSAGLRPNIACLAKETQQVNGRVVQRHLILHQQGVGAFTVASVPAEQMLLPLGVYAAPGGEVYYIYTRTVPGADGSQVWSTRFVVFQRGAQQESILPHGFPVSTDLSASGSGRHEPPLRLFPFRGELWVLFRDGGDLQLQSLSRLQAAVPPTSIAPGRHSLYDVRPVVGHDGFLYVFFHDVHEKRAHVAVSRDGIHFDDLVLDSEESGTQLEAFADARGVHAAYYYFRNTYEKGIRVVSLTNGNVAQQSCSLVREEKHNVGWGLFLLPERDGKIWLSYFDPVESETRVWSHLASVDELLACDTRPITEGAHHWFLQAGAGVWYANWELFGDALDADDTGGIDVGASGYRVDPTLLTTVSLEAKYKSWSFGLAYSQAKLDRELRKRDPADRLQGHLQLAKLFPGHDFKVEGVWGRYRGEVSSGANVEGPEERKFDTRYVDVKLFALNAWRIKYGIVFTQYAVPLTAHVHTAGVGQTTYSYEGSYLRNATINATTLMLGGSKLDYVAKYENYYNDIILDGAIGVGIAFNKFNAVPTAEGPATGNISLLLRGHLMLGWLYMQRIQSLRGLGFYLRPSYVVDGTAFGFLEPAERDEKDTTEVDSFVSTSLYGFHHGPWFDLGVVW